MLWTSRTLWMLLCNMHFKHLPRRAACYVATTISSNFQDVLHALNQCPQVSLVPVPSPRPRQRRGSPDLSHDVWVKVSQCWEPWAWQVEFCSGHFLAFDTVPQVVYPKWLARFIPVGFAAMPKCWYVPLSCCFYILVVSFLGPYVFLAALRNANVLRFLPESFAALAELQNVWLDKVRGSEHDMEAAFGCHMMPQQMDFLTYIVHDCPCGKRNNTHHS